MSFRSRTLGFWALPVALLLSVSACQSTTPPTEPTASPSASSAIGSSSPTESATPTPVPASADGPAQNIPVPEMPEEAQENSDEGALAFFNYYFDVTNYSLETYDPIPLEKLSSSSCEVCFQNLINGIKFNADEGGWQVGGLYIAKVTGTKRTSATEFVVAFSILSEAETLYSASGQVVDDSPRMEIPRYGAAILNFDTAWIMRSISFDNEAG